MIDKILSPVILIVTVVFLGIILYVSVFHGIASDTTIAREKYEQEYGELLVHSVFAAQENESGVTYEVLLTRSLRDVNTTIDINNKTIDVKRKYSETFDKLLGPNNYYMEVAPLLQGVTVSYVLDGSDTMKPRRDYVNTSLQPFISSLKSIFGADAAVNTHIYILKQDSSSSMCSGFYLAPGVTCNDIGGNPLYTFLKERGISPPFPFPSRTYAEWKASTHIAGDYDLSQSDWASGVMYASIKHAENQQEMAVSNKHIIVTVADELTTTSKADECFGIKNNPPEPRFISNNNLLFCYMCNATMPVNRSEFIINQTERTLEDNGDLFFGFNSFTCDYVYDTAFNDFAVSNYSCRYIDGTSACYAFSIDGSGGPEQVYPPANVNWCQQNKCGACKKSQTTPWDGKYCFHRESNALILSQLQTLADASGGKVLELTDITQLTSVVESYFQNLVQNFDFRIGVKDPTRDRYVVNKEIAFANGEKIKLTLWLYDTDVQ